jgi:heparin binding hemagglutinin HbhA
MAITAELTKSIERSLDSKPVYAVAGAGDFAVEKLRELSARLSSLSTVRVERRDVQEQVGTLQEETRTRLQQVQEAFRELPEQAQSVVGSVVATATELYDDFAERGELVVSRLRGQESTGELEEQAQSTVRRAKATKATATKGVTATKQSAKETVTSATDTAKAGGQAAADSADKIG